MQDRLVSIVIPVFNGERFIERTLASALAQSYGPIEIIVADDGSTDETPALVAAAAFKDNRIYMCRGPHRGPAAARNAAIGRARGSMIAPLDADDLWHPDKIARQAAVLKECSHDIGVVYCDYVNIDEGDLIIPPVQNNCSIRGDLLTELATRGNFFGNGSIPLIRRSALDAVGGYDESLGASEDWKLYMTLAETYGYAMVPMNLVGYRRRNTSLSHNTTVVEESIACIERWVAQKWPNLPPRTYNADIYLAERALAANHLAKAARYYLKGVDYAPAEVLNRVGAKFFARIFVRLFGLRRAARLFLSTRMPFNEYQPVKWR